MGDHLPATALGRVQFNPSTGVVLRFAIGTVTITGRNLRPVFEAATTRRLTWVREAGDPGKVGGDPDATVVVNITVDAMP